MAVDLLLGLRNAGLGSQLSDFPFSADICPGEGEALRFGNG